ncbi:hypothetical protein Leryth_008070 [Lithospermum erythrorhizon]|nr:hypothetical protein Leryth_008070 [Lithospermum erythrorhizon]
MALKMESLRLRLEFKNSDILTDAQRSLGLDKSWVLVNQPKTNFSTIGALSAHILHKFQLNQTCPDGLLLSMDGFALPPFVSIGILKDKDVISVQKIDYLTVEGSDATDKDDEEQQLVAINCVSTGTLLLSNEEFEEENGGHESEELDDESAEDGNDISKKRKASQKLKSPKKKKQRSEPCETVATGIHNESEYIETPHEDEVPSGKKRKSKKGKSSKTKNQTTGGDNARPYGKTEKDVESASNLKKKEQFQENDEDDGATTVSGRTRKGPSRSAQRQYAKRTMLREMKKVWDKNGDSLSKEVKKKKRRNKAEKGAGPDQLQNEGGDQPKGLLHLKQFGGRDISKVCSKPGEENQNSKSHGNSNKDNDTLNDGVPTEIRPGHIRIEAALEEDQQVQQTQASLVDEDSSLVDVHSVKNNNLHPSASRETKLADGGHICNENGVTSMLLRSNEKCTDSMVNSNDGTNQGNSAQATSTPENGVDLWEQLTEALNSKKEELSKESSWGKITPSKHTSSYEAFESGAVRPTTSYRGRGRNYQTSFRGGRGRGRNYPTMSYRGRGRNHG